MRIHVHTLKPFLEVITIPKEHNNKINILLNLTLTYNVYYRKIIIYTVGCTQ